MNSLFQVRTPGDIHIMYWFLKLGVQETSNLLSVIRVTDYNQSGDRILISWCLKRTIKAPSACLELMNNEGFVSQQAATAPIQEGRTTLSASSSSCSSAAAPSLRFQLYVSSAEREVSWMLTLQEIRVSTLHGLPSFYSVIGSQVSLLLFWLLI